MNSAILPIMDGMIIEPMLAVVKIKLHASGYFLIIVPVKETVVG